MDNVNIKLPDGLCKEAREYINEVIKELDSNRLLKRIDSAALTMLAINYSMFIQANKELSRDGLSVRNVQGNIVAHPSIKVAKDAQSQAVVILKDFGLTVKSRSKLPIQDTNTEEDDDVIAKFTKNKPLFT